MAAGHSRKCLPKEMQQRVDEGEVVACRLALLTEWCPLTSTVYYILWQLQQGTEGRQMSMGECTGDEATFEAEWSESAPQEYNRCNKQATLPTWKLVLVLSS